MENEVTVTPIPTIGRIVKYRLSAQDVEQIMRRRTNGHKIRERMELDPPQWPAGAQVHIGNDVYENQEVPMLIVAVWGPSPTSAVNGQAFLDGNDVLWVTSVSVGEGSHTYSWPGRS